jgi:hypothetical protein
MAYSVLSYHFSLINEACSMLVRFLFSLSKSNFLMTQGLKYCSMGEKYLLAMQSENSVQ